MDNKLNVFVLVNILLMFQVGVLGEISDGAQPYENNSMSGKLSDTHDLPLETVIENLLTLRGAEYLHLRVEVIQRRADVGKFLSDNLDSPDWKKSMIYRSVHERIIDPQRYREYDKALDYAIELLKEFQPYRNYDPYEYIKPIAEHLTTRKFSEDMYWDRFKSKEENEARIKERREEILQPYAELLSFTKKDAEPFLVESVLKDDNDLKRIFGLTRLSKIGYQHIEALRLKVLENDPSWQVGKLAAEELEDAELSKQVLLDTLEETKSNYSLDVAIIDALGRLHITESIPKLSEMLKKSDNSYIKRSIIKAFGQFASKEVVEPLRAKVLKPDDSDIQLNAASVLIRIDYPAFASLLDEKDSVSIRRLYAGALYGKPDIRSEEKLIEFLKDEDSVVRENAIYALGALKSKKAVGEIAFALSHDESDVRYSAVRSLGEIGGGQAEDALIECMTDDSNSEFLRKESVRRLGQMKSKRVTDALIERLRNEPHPEVREEIIDILTEVGDPNAIPALESVLEREKLGTGTY